MKQSVVFHDLITDISIHPTAKFEQVRFIYGTNGGLKDPKSGKVYPVIRGIEVHFEIDHEPHRGRELLEPLETALYIAEEVFTALVAKTQCYCYLARPLTCTFNGKKYSHEDGHWGEALPRDNIITGGEVFLDEAPYLDEDKNFHPMYHFYRAAKDETNTNDYRALNAWRFLEALYGKSDSALKDHLINVEGQLKPTVDSFYENVRCAITHAKYIKNNPETDKVIIPRSY